MRTSDPSGAPAVVLAGCGLVTPRGAGTNADPRDSAGGKEPGGGLWIIPDSLLSSLPEPPPELAKDRSGRIAAAALTFALRDAGVSIPPEEPARFGLILTIAQAGQAGMIRFAEEVRAQSPRFVSPIHFPETVGNYLAAALARGFGFRGPNVTLTGDSAGMEAVVEAIQLLAHGAADVVAVGGCEMWTEALLEPAAGERHASEAACFWVLRRQDDSKLSMRKAIVRCPASVSADQTYSQDTILATGMREGVHSVERTMGWCPSAGVFLAGAMATLIARDHKVRIVPESSLGKQDNAIELESCA